MKDNIRCREGGDGGGRQIQPCEGYSSMATLEAGLLLHGSTNSSISGPAATLSIAFQYALYVQYIRIGSFPCKLTLKVVNTATAAENYLLAVTKCIQSYGWKSKWQDPISAL